MSRPRSLGLRFGEAATPAARDRLGPDNLDAGRYHPWQTPLDSVFPQALQSTEPTLNWNYSENREMIRLRPMAAFEVDCVVESSISHPLTSAQRPATRD